MNRLILSAGLLLILAACGGSDGGDSVGAGEGGLVVIESADGIATLTLDPASLPEDVAISDISLHAGIDDKTHPEAPVAAVALEPSGLILSIPATISITVPDVLEGGIVAVHQSGEYIEFLDVSLNVTDGTTQVSAELDRFSTLGIYVYGLTESATVTPYEVRQYDDQSVSGTISVEPPQDRTIWVRLSGETGIRKVVFTMPLRPISVSDAEGYWHNHSWSPRHVATSVVTNDDSWTIEPATSKCQLPNIGSAGYSATVRFHTKLISVSEESPAEIVWLGEIFTKSGDGKGANYAPYDDDWVNIVDTPPGELIPITSKTIESDSTVCLADGEPSLTTSSTSSTTSSTLDMSEVPPGQDPRAHVTGITPVATANSTIGLNVTFAQPWGMEPPFDLFSFFVLFNILQGNLSALAGWEVHNEVVTPYGPGPTFLMSDGSVFIDTGFPVGPGALIDVTGRNGSMDSDTATPVFDEFVFVVNPTEPLPIDPNDPVWDLVNNSPFP